MFRVGVEGESFTFIIGEIVLHWACRELLLESIDLVEEQNDGCLNEPSGIADGIKKGQSFLHTVDGFVLEQKLVIFGNGDQEEDCGNILKAVYPFLSFRTLTTDIEHPVCEVSDNESCLGDTSGFDTRPKNILVVGDVIRSSNAVN
jgi:hypothetical protein